MTTLWGDLTWELLESDFQAAYKTTARVGPGKLAEIKEESGGFTSQVVFVTLDWIGEGAAELPGKAVLKIVSSQTLKDIKNLTVEGSTEDGEMDVPAMLNNNELNFYRHWHKWGLGDLPVVKFLAGRDVEAGSAIGYIALEYKEGMTARFLYNTIPEESFIQFLKVMAKVHGTTLANQSFASDFPSNVRKLLNSKYVTYASTASHLEKVLEQYPEAAEKINNMKEYAKIYSDYDREQAIRKKTCPIELLAHGDTSLANVLWQKHGEKGLDLTALHDWQTCHVGNPFMDLSRLMALSLAPELLQNRRNHYLHIYYNEFKTHAGEATPWKNGDEVVDAFEQIFPLEMVSVTSLLVPFVPLMLRTCPESEKEAVKVELFEKLRGVIDLCDEFIRKWNLTQ
ncbi:unnamed protein product, partial [Mesorhabditis spiculigera]